VGVVEDENQRERVDVGEVFFQQDEARTAFEAGPFAEFGEQDFQYPAGGEGGLGDEQCASAFISGLFSSLSLKMAKLMVMKIEPMAGLQSPPM
jgi:hypothetical protein